eukprot:9420177-Pyramimonas_sp.AAC.1
MLTDGYCREQALAVAQHFSRIAEQHSYECIQFSATAALTLFVSVWFVEVHGFAPVPPIQSCNRASASHPEL